LATIYPGAISLSVWILSEAPFCPLMLLQLVLWILAWQSSSPGRRAVFGIGAGLAGGAATLMRPSWLLFTPMAVAVEMWMQTRGRRRGSSRAIPTTEGETTRLAAADHRFAAVPAAACGK
jgi:hypothetical protein